MPTLTRITPMLFTKSIDETIEFYTKTLDFRVNGRIEPWCCLSFGDVDLMFATGVSDGADAPRMTGVLYFNPDDVKALWERYKDRAKVEWSLQVMPYDMAEFAIRDNNGYILTFGQDIKSVQPPLPPRCEE